MSSDKKQINILDDVFRIECNGKAFIIVKDLLCARSGYFNTLLGDNPLQNEYVDNDIDSSILNIVVDMMCSTIINTEYSKNVCIQIYTVCDKFDCCETERNIIISKCVTEFVIDHELVEFIISHGKLDDVNALWDRYFIECKYVEGCIDLFLNAGVDINVRNKYGKTALIEACINSNKYSSLKNINILMNMGADINAMDKKDWSPLTITSRFSNEKSSSETAIALIDASATIDSKDKYGSTPLMTACQYANNSNALKVIDALINASADLNASDKKGWTSLMKACRYSTKYSSLETVNTLIDACSDMNAENNDGWTSLMMACRYSNKDSSLETAIALINAGAYIDTKIKKV